MITTLDCIPNKPEHSLSNCKPCCKRINSLKSDSDDLEIINLKVQLYNFTFEHGCPMKLGKCSRNNYFIIRDNITERLTNTHPRLNIAGESEI
jgi:hypothetical protein